MHAFESETHLCPENLCPKLHTSVLQRNYGLFVSGLRVLLTRTLPRSLSTEVVRTNGDIALEENADASLARYGEFLHDIGAPGAHDGLYLDHLLLPHAPWRFLPSGAKYDFRGIDGWYPTEHWGTDAWPVLQGYQRHLLQVAYTDRVLGRLLRRLDKSGLYDRALVIVTPDHGVSFRAGQGRRPLTGDNLADITNIPLFVKYPGQRHGHVDRRPARSIDVLPTIADVLGIRLPWTVDGTSLRGPIPAERDVTVALRGSKVLHAPLERMIRDRALTLARKYAAFGQGHDSLYRIGENRWFLDAMPRSFGRLRRASQFRSTTPMLSRTCAGRRASYPCGSRERSPRAGSIQRRSSQSPSTAGSRPSRTCSRGPVRSGSVRWFPRAPSATASIRWTYS